MRIEFHPLARAELREEVQFYAAKARGLGQGLRDEVRSVTDILARMPHAGQEERAGVRRLPLRRFPYAVFYRPELQRVYVLAVAHQRREPGYWLDRLNG